MFSMNITDFNRFLSQIQCKVRIYINMVATFEILVIQNDFSRIQISM